MRAFSYLELIFIIVIIVAIITLSKPKINTTQLDLATQKLVLYLNYTRYIGLLDNKYNHTDLEWEKKLWSLKFQKCSDKKDGLYFVVFSDMSGGTGAFKKKETLKDPLTNKYLYSNYDCTASEDESKEVLLTKEYGITNVEISCNTTSTIGQISFGHDGNIYSQLGQNIKKINKPCMITIYDKDMNSKVIQVEARTGFIHKL